MSFLAPLYLAGLAAVSIPLVLHLIRRTPTGRVSFSSLMFLVASPPKVTRRSRVENWPLLILRALSICLLAAAFARPLIRQLELKADEDLISEELVVLIDASASMQRENLWQAMLEKCNEVLESTGYNDRVAVFVFDEELSHVIDFEEWSSLEPRARNRITLDRLANRTPGWKGTHLGEALMSAAVKLSETSANSAHTSRRSIRLISDCQSGSRLASLDAYDWPESIGVQIVRVDPLTPGNAGFQQMAADQSRAERLAVRLQVHNSTDAVRRNLDVRLVDINATHAGTSSEQSSVVVTVSPGETQATEFVLPVDGSHSKYAVLSNDAHEFDNIFFIAPQHRETVIVAHLGEGELDVPGSAQYFLERAFSQTPQRSVEVIHLRGEDRLPSPIRDKMRLVIVTEIPSVSNDEILQQYLQSGGTIAYVVNSAKQREGIRRLLGAEAAWVDAEEITTHAFLSDVDYSHPMFAVFAEPQFADFTRISFWKHQRLQPGEIGRHEVPARFDNGDPAVIEFRRGAGRVIAFTSGWSQVDSQLALSSKFVPMLNGLIDLDPKSQPARTQFVVGEQFEDSSTMAGEGATIELMGTEGSRQTLKSTDGAMTDRPGIYRITTSMSELVVAVNVDPNETETSPIEPKQLAAHGVRLSHGQVQDVVEYERKRQAQVRELEHRQRLWQWLILAALATLLAETWWSYDPLRKTQASTGKAG